jgi:hypothetical protein
MVKPFTHSGYFTYHVLQGSETTHLSIQSMLLCMILKKKKAVNFLNCTDRSSFVCDKQCVSVTCKPEVQNYLQESESVRKWT